MTRMPNLVIRILDDLGQGHLVGDLAEELHHGRPFTWVWWQVTAALAQGVVSTLRAHPYLTFRAVALGWITVAVLDGQLPFNPHPAVGTWIHQSPAWVPLIAAQYVVAGWVVARLHPLYRMAMVVGAAAFLTLVNAITVGTQLYFILRFGESIHVAISLMTALTLVTSFCLPLMTIVGGLHGVRRPLARTR
jgi:hypothetical protein